MQLLLSQSKFSFEKLEIIAARAANPNNLLAKEDIKLVSAHQASSMAGSTYTTTQIFHACCAIASTSTTSKNRMFCKSPSIQLLIAIERTSSIGLLENALCSMPPRIRRPDPHPTYNTLHIPLRLIDNEARNFSLLRLSERRARKRAFIRHLDPLNHRRPRPACNKHRLTGINMIPPVRAPALGTAQDAVDEAAACAGRLGKDPSCELRALRAGHSAEGGEEGGRAPRGGREEGGEARGVAEMVQTVLADEFGAAGLEDDGRRDRKSVV